MSSKISYEDWQTFLTLYYAHKNASNELKPRLSMSSMRMGQAFCSFFMLPKAECVELYTTEDNNRAIEIICADWIKWPE